ncbi:glycoside hydrolase family 28 protein [Teratosphaeria destructans]|uniref:galacturonan 1,4-alpha-galacturonidase n=1 Tax=Teratosphaeria destructans TaxID=418781 RepID=A0A9W7SU08_9PEZI|nr:glycoside hydrolase family 28 protein [Teratosphaeria destructans]
MHKPPFLAVAGRDRSLKMLIHLVSWLSVLASVDTAQALSSPKSRCTIPSQYAASNGKADDSPAIAAAFAECATDATITFVEGTDYNVFTPIKATNLSNVRIEVFGNLHLPQDIASVQALVNRTEQASGSTDLHWFTFVGRDIDYIGSAKANSGWINSYGQAWWDANVHPGTGLPGRPHLMQFHTKGGSMQYFKSRKPIAWNVGLSGSNILVSNVFIDAYSTTGSFPFNTDGFDISGTDITIQDSVIYNGDDAICIQTGSHRVVFKDSTIGYQSHGMSIGGLGRDPASFANVSDITFDNINVINALYAARFKSSRGGQGLAKNVRWTNIRLYNVTFPIFVTQLYVDQGVSSLQAETKRPNNSTVNMEDFTWANFTGTINTFQPGDGSCKTDPCWYYYGLPDLKHTEAIIIECNTDESCKNFQFSNIDVVPQSLDAPSVVCIDATAELNPSLGFVCANGTYKPTA